MTDDDRHAVPLDANLSRSRDRQVGVRLPIALDDRLDRLVASAEAAGDRTNRKEILAALVAVCSLDGPGLGSALRTYRTMSVRDVQPGIPDDVGVVRLADHRPGPRTAGK